MTTPPTLGPGDAVLGVNLLMEGCVACEGLTSESPYKHTRYVASFLQLLESAVLHEHVWPKAIWGKPGPVKGSHSYVHPLEDVLYREGILVNFQGLATLTDADALRNRISTYSAAHEQPPRFVEEIAFAETAHVQIRPDFDDVEQFAGTLLSNQERLSQTILAQVYSNLSSGLQSHLDEIARLTHVDEVLIPPIAAMIVSTASTLADVPDVLLHTRKRMAKVRNAFREYETVLRDPDRSLKERIRVVRDIQLISKELARPYDVIDSVHLTEWPDIVGVIQQAVQSPLSPASIVRELVGKPLSYVVDRLRLRKAHYLFSLRQKSLTAPNLVGKIDKLFGNHVDVDLATLSRFLSPAKDALRVDEMGRRPDPARS